MDQLGAEPANLPVVHLDFARDPRAHVTERVDGDRMFIGKRDLRQIFTRHPAIFGGFCGPALSRFRGCCYIIPNPCSRMAPCKTFAGAISKTAPAGEINVLDPGGFGAVTITKSITIRSDHIEAGVLVANGVNGINIQAGPNDTVILEGLDIEGLGTGNQGVAIFSGKSVYI